MKKFRSISDVYQSGIPYKDIDVPKYNRSKNLNEAYTLIREAKNPDVLSPEAIHAITGVDADIMINYYRYIRADGTLNHILKNVEISVGAPSYRAVNPKLSRKNYHALAKYFKTVAEEKDEPFKITTAGVVKKLRTPSGGRVCEWSGAEKRIDVLKDPAGNPIDSIRDINLLRVIAILHLLHEFANDLEQVDKMPPGISYEIDQIETFNNNLQELAPMGFILPGSNELYRDKDGKVVLIDGAADVKGVPKADMSLTLDGKQVFWISYKHGEYVSDVTKPTQIPFQQYGSPGGIYGDEDLKPIVDRFLTGVASEIGNYFSREDLIELGLQSEEAPDGTNENLAHIYSKQLLKMTKKGVPAKTIFNKHKVDHFHLYPSGTNEITAKLFDQNSKPLGSKLEMVGLKSIYGDDYDGKSDTPFGINNVNILLQTPQSANFEVMRGTPEDPDESIAIRMTMVEKSHIIKNPDLPDSVPYLPCMYIRHTVANYFIFKNIKTNRMEAILGGRLLMYPQGNVSHNSNLINIFEG